MKIRCTPQDYVKFIGYCREYIDRFHLGQWEIVYKFDKKKESDKLAHCEFGVNALHAKITLYADWSPQNEVTDKTLRETALHEVLHLMFADLTYAEICSKGEVLIREREHEVINRIILGLLYKRHK
jgi:hypothetical protein